MSRYVCEVRHWFAYYVLINSMAFMRSCVGLNTLLSCLHPSILSWACLKFCHNPFHVGKCKRDGFILVNCHYWALVFTLSLIIYYWGALVRSFLNNFWRVVVIKDYWGLPTVLNKLRILVYFLQHLFSPHLLFHFVRYFSLQILICGESIHKIRYAVSFMHDLRRLIVTLLGMLFRR